MSDAINPSARLLRGFAVDFLASHDIDVIGSIMDPAYCLNIGGYAIDGREAAYRPALVTLFEQYPGLCVTVHDVMFAPGAAALRFTEHGAAAKPPGSAAAWGGIAMFRIEHGRLQMGWAEEDYLARKRQLKSGRCDPVRPPHPAPWDAPCEPADPATEAGVKRWLADPAAILKAGVVEEVSAEGPGFAALVAADRPVDCKLVVLFSAGARAAFCLECAGSYAGGFADIDAALTGTPVTLRVTALATVKDGGVAKVQAVADRLGLHRQLLEARSRSPAAT